MVVYSSKGTHKVVGASGECCFVATVVLVVDTSGMRSGSGDACWQQSVGLEGLSGFCVSKVADLARGFYN